MLNYQTFKQKLSIKQRQPAGTQNTSLKAILYLLNQNRCLILTESVCKKTAGFDTFPRLIITSLVHLNC